MPKQPSTGDSPRWTPESSFSISIRQFQLDDVLGTTKKIFYEPFPAMNQVLGELHRVRSLSGSKRASLRSIRSSINYLGLRRHRYIMDRLKESRIALLTVLGENDIIIPIPHAHQVRRELSNSTVLTMPECGHWPHMERADEFNLLLAQFLRHATVDSTSLADG